MTLVQDGKADLTEDPPARHRTTAVDFTVGEGVGLTTSGMRGSLLTPPNGILAGDRLWGPDIPWGTLEEELDQILQGGQGAG